MGIIRRIVYNAMDNEMSPNLNNPNANVVYAAPAAVGYDPGYGRGCGRGFGRGFGLAGGPYYDRHDRRMARRDYRDMRRGYIDPPLVAVGTVPLPMQQQQMMMMQQQQQQQMYNNNNMQYQQGPPPPQQYNNNNNMQYAPPQGPPMYSRDMSPQNSGNGNNNFNNNNGSSSRDMPRGGNSPQPRGFFDEESDVHAPPPYVDNRHSQQGRDEKN